jgi:hypothetical protein
MAGLIRIEREILTLNSFGRFSVGVSPAEYIAVDKAGEYPALCSGQARTIKFVEVSGKSYLEALLPENFVLCTATQDFMSKNPPITDVLHGLASGMRIGQYVIDRSGEVQRYIHGRVRFLSPDVGK